MGVVSLKWVLISCFLIFSQSVHAEPYVDMVEYEYDGLNRLLVSSSGAGISQAFSLDDVANREIETRRNAAIGAPTAVSDVYSVDENATLTVSSSNGVFHNDVTSSVTNPVAHQVVAPLFGSFTLNTDGSFTYQPNADYFGDDEFAYQVRSDTFSSNVVRVRLSIIPENPQPIANNDMVITGEDQSFLIPVLSNDSSVTTIISVDAPFHGSAVIQGSSILYTPNNDYSGQDIFIYRAEGTQGIASAKVVVTVNPQNDAPQVHNSEHWMDWGETARIPVLVNAIDPEGEVLNLTNVSTAQHGTTSIDAGDVVYTPTVFAPTGDGDGDDTVMSETFTYTVADESNNQSQATILIRVTNNPVPIAVNDCYDPVDLANNGVTADCVGNNLFRVEYEQATVLPVLANDYDPSGDQIVLKSVSVPSFGSASIINNELYYTPNNGQENAIDIFQYQIEDSVGQVSSAIVYVFIGFEDNTPFLPTPKDDCYHSGSSAGCTPSSDYLVDFASGELLSVLNNDTDPNDEQLTITFVSPPAYGSTSKMGNQILYTPSSGANINGFQDTFFYVVQNQRGLTAQATVYVEVKPRDNKAPVARADSASLIKDRARDIMVTSNDSDANYDTVSILPGSVTSPSHGSAIRLNATTVRYTPHNNFIGQDSFRYKATDGNGLQSAETVVTVTVREFVTITPIIQMLLLDGEQ